MPQASVAIFADLLRQRRLAAGLTQEALAHDHRSDAAADALIARLQMAGNHLSRRLGFIPPDDAVDGRAVSAPFRSGRCARRRCC